MENLTKKYRLIWSDGKVIAVRCYDLKSVTKCINGFESDVKQEVTDKVAELNLTMTEEQIQEWSQVE